MEVERGVMKEENKISLKQSSMFENHAQTNNMLHLLDKLEALEAKWEKMEGQIKYPAN